MSDPLLLIRADANVAIGTGHVMRCLSLAQAWQDAGGQAVFGGAELPGPLRERLVSERMPVVGIPWPTGSLTDADSTIEIARERGALWVVIDGDHFGEEFLHRVQAAGLRILLVDDFAKRQSFPADLILNPNPGATEGPYRKRGARARLCLGKSYVLLRREFTSWKGSRIFPETACKVLVTLGGSDPENLTIRIVEALAPMPSVQITAVAGPGYAHASELQQLGSSNIRVLLNPPNIGEVMEQADIAVIAAGGTLWELLYMQCVVLSYARNPVQARVIEELGRRGAVRHMGATTGFNGRTLVAAVDELAQSRVLREQMASMGRQTVDGRGATRVLQALRDLGGCG